MNNKQSYKAYAAAAQTVAKTRQVIMLYDATIKSVQQAIVAIEAGDIQVRYNSLIKAGEIVFGLQGSLDFDNGGDVAQALYDFYASIDARLLSVHRSNSAETCEQVLKELKMMRDTWIEIDKDEQDDALEPAEAASSESHSSDKPQPPEGGVAISA